MAKHDGIIPSDEADKLRSYPTLSGVNTQYLKGNGTWAEHPAYTARTGQPTANQTPAFGNTFTVSQIKSDATGHITTATNRTVKIPNTTATTTTAGLMSAADKEKLEGIETGAQVNTVAGVKGNAENAYRTGNVNITAANVGAAASNHNHDTTYAKLSGATFTGGITVPTVTGALSGNATSANKLQTARSLGGFDFDGTADIVRYVRCTTAAGVQTKVLTIPNFVIQSGAWFILWMGNSNTATEPVFEINEFEPEPFYDYKNEAIQGDRLVKGMYIVVRSNGGHWLIVAAPEEYHSVSKIDGMSFNGTADVSHYFLCTTAAGTVAKTASNSSQFQYGDGFWAVVIISFTNTANEPTLNLNGKGALPIHSGNGNRLNGTELQKGGHVFVLYKDKWYDVGNNT